MHQSERLPRAPRAAERNAIDSNGLQFAVPPGWYQLVCEVAVPGFTAKRGDGRQTVPGAGEWTGTITTRSLNVAWSRRMHLRRNRASSGRMWTSAKTVGFLSIGRR